MTEAMYITVTKQDWVGGIEGKRRREWTDEDFVNMIVSVDRLPFDLECWWSEQFWRNIQSKPT